MSYFRLQANIISKKNQSAVASASYRSGEELYSERDGEMKSFRKREVAPISFILKPDHAPEWTLDREKLWNEVEKIEKAWNAQLAREVLIALPIELNADQQHELVQRFVQTEFVGAGMVADVSIHRDKVHNPHAHILLTIRPFNEDGSWGNKKVRQYEYDQDGEILRNDAGEKVFQTVSSTDWNERETLVKWRLDYAEAINQAFKEHGIEKTVSALSFEEQGLDRIPEIRMERNEYQYVKRMEKKGLEAKTFYHQLNQEIRKTNAEIKQLNQKITFLSAKQKTVDVQSILHHHSMEVMQQLDSDYQKSLRFMEGRLNGNVSLQTVHKQLEGLYRWEERTLEPKQVETSVTHTILNATHSAYQRRDAAILKDQGFPVQNFLSVFTERLEAFEKLGEAVDKEKQTNETVTAHLERSFRVHSLIVHNAFNELYPEIEDRYQFNDRTVDFKAELLEAMKDGEWQRVPPPHEMNHQLQRHELKKVCSQAEKVSDSIRIQSLMRNKLGTEKEQLLKTGKDLNAIYETSVKLNTTQKLVERYQEKATHFDKQLSDMIRQTFPHAKESLLRKVDALPLEMKTDLLKHFAKETAFHKKPTFKECLQAAQKEQEKRTASFANYRNQQSSSFYQRLTSEQQQTGHFPSGQASTELVDELVRQAAHPNSYEKDLGQLAKLNRKGRNTRMRRHLGLEINL
ncbi:MobQ family relaxase [Planococcus sp. 1R117A]|uniref:MobQ family relaxase n=1 Tax=Planococcus sp. 1R117A TaxID=3447020 RepID=UPI003EDC9977